MNPVPAPERSSPDATRRRFLKGGVALGAALAAGATRSAAGQPAPDDPSRVVGGPMVPYGERSRFEDAVRQKGPPFLPDEWGGNFTPLERDAGDHHTVGAPLRSLPGRRSRHRSPASIAC